MPGSFGATTKEMLQQAGYRVAFLTRSDFATGNDDPYELPRIALPDRPMAIGEFRARVRGGGIVIENLRGQMRHLLGRSADATPNQYAPL